MAVCPPLSIAPMMDRSDRHFRWFMRQITRHTLLYTEMVVSRAIVHGDRDKLLGFDPVERPLALQLGGDDPAELALCARIAEDLGYDEVNLNVGCPSARVQRGRFGACLMREPDRVAACVAAMGDAVRIPVTVKHRLGVDDLDAYEDVLDFVDTVAPAGCARFTVHARKAWLSGLSPKENRNVPPLRYGEVFRLRRERPGVPVELNGGIRSLDEVQRHLEQVDACMLGRAAWDDPYLFAEADARFFGSDLPGPTRAEVVARVMPYVARHTGADFKLHHVTRGMLNLYRGQRGSRRWKRTLAEGSIAGAGVEVLEAGLASLDALSLA